MRSARDSQRPMRLIAKILGVWIILVAMALGAEDLSFDYTITAQPGHIYLHGTTNLPNGVVLVGRLDKIGAGVLDVKEAFVMNRAFAMEFGPRLQAYYHLIGPVDAMTAGPYRIRVEFDPAQQSPFTRELLVQGRLMHSSAVKEDGTREFDPATVRVAKTILLGTPEEQEMAQTIEQQSQQRIRQHLSEALGMLMTFWQRLRAEYQQERTRGFSSRADARVASWQTWSAQWVQDLGAATSTYVLHENVSPVSPYFHLRSTLVALQKHLLGLVDSYFEVLLNERAASDRDLQWLEREIELAFSDANAQSGYPLTTPPAAAKGEAMRPAVVVTSALVNIRKGPAMTFDVVTRAKKDDGFELLGDKGEWFQVQLSDGRTGWLHQNVASKKALSGGTPEAKRADAKPLSPERKGSLQLQPIPL
ncbi:MAG: SH3 domain-containing protein, partial [Candidatus Entotheonellia bacterium]